MVASRLDASTRNEWLAGVSRQGLVEYVKPIPDGKDVGAGGVEEERREQERLEQERLAKRRREEERLEQERLEQERLAKLRQN